MLGSSILDVAIGMAFIFLLLSLIASTVQEAISAVLQTRSANLEHGIRSLFSGGRLDGHYLVDLIYKHGLIRSLYRDPKMDRPNPNDPDGAAAPVEQPGMLGTLVRKLFGNKQPVVAANHPDLPGAPPRRQRPMLEMMRAMLGVSQSEITPAISDPFLLPAYIPARTFAMTLIDILNPDKKSGDALVADIETRLTALAKPATGKPDKGAEAILALLIDAGNAKDSAEKFRSNLENWYNDGMDRVSGWYKKYTQKILIVIGLILAIAFNVDSIQVGRTLWFDHDARQGLVSAANSFVASNPKTDKEKDDAAAGATAPLPTGPTQKELTQKMETTVRAFNDVSSKYLLPVGWKYSLDDYKHIVMHPRTEWHGMHLLEQLAGWVLTALALSLGAPFWFDTLNKFMVVRSTVKPQEKSLNEPSKS